MSKDLTHYPLLTESYSPEVIILANGTFPTHSLPLNLLKQAQYVVCCDGAANEYINQGFEPQIIVGDGDSLSNDNKARFVDKIYYSSDTETNDLTKAVELCIRHRKKNILIIGATGEREDHTLGNISLLMDYMDKVEVQMVTDHGVFTPVNTDASYESYPGQTVSIINFKATAIKGSGLEYPLKTFKKWWQGTLNKSRGDSFIIWTRGKILVFRAF